MSILAALVVLFPQSTTPQNTPPQQAPKKAGHMQKQGPAPAKNAPTGSQYALPTAKKDEAPFSTPFRTFLPKKDFELSKGWQSIFADANELYRLWRATPGASYDDDGRPSARSDHFDKLREGLAKRLVRQGAMLRIYRSQGSNAARRRAAIFASLFVKPTQDAVHLLRLLPYEPVPSLRAESIGFSKAFLSTQVGKQQVSASGSPMGPEFVFDAAPWLDLSRSKLPRDQELALDVLIAVGKARGAPLRAALPMMKPWVPTLLRSKTEGVRVRARAFLSVLEASARVPEDIEASVEYFERIYKKLFPPIRLRGGICELFASPEVTALLEDGESVLEDPRATRLESRAVKKRFGSFERQGIRLVRVPERMKKAGFDDSMLLVALNGQPITSASDLLERFEAAAREQRKRFVLEWVTPKGEERARTYRLRPAEK